ncbi:MAG TPA: PEP-CTERM sorting domain-containing protein [Bryobacteraceae bacterium]|nr:PEP-CTERM sorting domain-containing protein [Bryobacteraceae bacterium]
MPRVEKAVYPYSVVPGGVWSKEDVARAAQSDTVVADHYAEIDADHIRPVTVVKPARAYVSYRKNGKIYWSSRRISLHQGETLLTDGSQCVRGRCGNRLSEVPREPALPPAQEPDETALNSNPVLIADAPSANEPVFEFPTTGMRIPVLPRPALISEIASAAPASAILQPAREGSAGADPGWYLPGPAGIAPLLLARGSTPGGGTDPVTPPTVQPPEVIIDPENPPDKPTPGGPDPGGEPQDPLPFIPLPPRPPVPPPFVVPPNVIVPPEIIIPPDEPEIPVVPPDGPEPPGPPGPPGPPEISETPEPATLLTIPAGLGLLILRKRYSRRKTGQENRMRSSKTLD